MIRSAAFFLAVPALAVTLGLSGCASPRAANPSAWTPNRTVASHLTPFWFGNQPGSGPGTGIPGRILARGEKVRFLRNHLGFAEVQLDDLAVGWVPRGVLR
ncbi:MAG: hypothetical protein H7A53_06885 [Akkermansiaceae bacterium]|nr:hypothetical protein [Akkermansiaceae bacterium]MCP5550597.1 hypothetical protein [Akkermansiaceae bacterium]